MKKRQKCLLGFLSATLGIFAHRLGLRRDLCEVDDRRGFEPELRLVDQNAKVDLPSLERPMGHRRADREAVIARRGADLAWSARVSKYALLLILFVFACDPGLAKEVEGEIEEAATGEPQLGGGGGDVPPAPCLSMPRSVAYQQGADGVTVENQYYRAHLNIWTGALDRLELRAPEGQTWPALLTEERVQIQTAQGLFGESHFGGTRFVIPEALNSDGHRLYPSPNYLKVITESPLNGTDLIVRRVYEFTQSEHVYVQFEIIATAEEELRSWYWVFAMPRGSSLVMSGLKPVISFSYPDYPAGLHNRIEHPLNSLKTNYRGYELHINDQPTSVGWVRSTRHSVNLEPFQRVLSNVVLSAVPAGAWPPNFAIYPIQGNYQFFPEYGLLSQVTEEKANDASCGVDFDLPAGRPSGRSERFFNFNNWATYEGLNRYAPIQDYLPGSVNKQPRIALDQLLRANLHLLERMARDGGWPKAPGWSVYPCGKQYSENSRGFTSAIYLWAVLSLGWNGSEWVTCSNAADPLLEQLQFTSGFFEPTQVATFAAQLAGPSFEDYIGYVTTNQVNGAIAAHSLGLHFIALMRDASRLSGNTAAMTGWTNRLQRFHRGSKKLFELLHPGVDIVDSSRVHPGHLSYSLDQPSLKGDNYHDYSKITFESIVPGYLEAGEYELELTEAIERARVDWQVEPEYFSPNPDLKFVWTLTRANPLNLAFQREPSALDPDSTPAHNKEYGMGSFYLESALNLEDILNYGRLPLTSVYSPEYYIRDSGGARWVLTNARVISDWVPGAWEEVTSAAVPADRRFTVEVPGLAADGSAGYWAAVQKGDALEFMSSALQTIRPAITVDAVYGGARIRVKRHQPIWNGYPHHGVWRTEEDIAVHSACVRDGDRCIFTLPPGEVLNRKDLLIVTLERRPGVPTNLRTAAPAFFWNYSFQWNPVLATAANGTLRYEIQESNNVIFAGATITNLGAAVSAAFSQRSDGTWYYRVRACMTVCGVFSAPVSRKVQMLPGAPAFLRAVASGAPDFSLWWGAPAGYVTNFEIQEAHDSQFFNPKKVILASHLRWHDYLGKAHDGYYYRIRAYNAAYTSPWVALPSKVIVLKAPPGGWPPSVAPPAPGSLTGSAAAGGVVSLSWSAGTVTHYILERSTIERFSSGVEIIYAGSATSFTAQPTPDKYYYRVRACNNTSCSANTIARNSVLVP